MEEKGVFVINLLGGGFEAGVCYLLSRLSEATEPAGS